MVLPSRRCSLAISMRISTRSSASRFDSGSSNRNTLGSPHDGAAHRDALTLAAGQLPRLARQHRSDFEDPRGLLHPGVDLRLRHAAIAQPIGHVVVDAHMRIERVVLEHHRDVALGRLDLVDDAPADIDLAGRDGLQSGDHAQQRRLAAAGWADENDEFTVADVEVDPLDDLHPSEALAHVAHREAGHAVLPCFLDTGGFRLPGTARAGGLSFVQPVTSPSKVGLQKLLLA